jgi:hypothetical protein
MLWVRIITMCSNNAMGSHYYNLLQQCYGFALLQSAPTMVWVRIITVTCSNNDNAATLHSNNDACSRIYKCSTSDLDSHCCNNVFEQCRRFMQIPSFLGKKKLETDIHGLLTPNIKATDKMTVLYMWTFAYVDIKREDNILKWTSE